MKARWLCALALLAALAACQQSQPPPATRVTHPNAPPGIAWFDGSVEQAFDAAKRERRPVLLYWGAQWCPFCHTLKSKVFSRPDFTAKTALFVPVYLDGDDAGAQKWAEQFGIQGYPTLIVLDAEQHELLRLGAGRDVSQYAAVLDLALADLQPVEGLLQAAASGTALDSNECRRLAYNEWQLDTLSEADYATRAERLQAAVAQCPADAKTERARLSIDAAYYAANAQSAALAAPKGAPSAQLSALIDQVQGILMEPELALESAEALQNLDESFFKAVRVRGGKLAPALRDDYVAAMNAAANDSHFVAADQLGFIDAKLRALLALGTPPNKLPPADVEDAKQRIDAALAAEQSPYVRAGLVNASLDILEDVGDLPKAYTIAQAEIGRSETPYYFQADLAEIAEKLGHKDEAISLLEQAYRGSRGAATRFQWGQLYVSGLLRMAPNDVMRIEDTGAQVLGELDGPDRIYRRARARLEKLDRELRAWDDAAKGQHQQVLHDLRARMQQICVKIPDKEAARASCDAFLKSA